MAEIAASVGTPFYVYSTATLVRHFKLFDDALDGLDHCICYAMKAASNQAILKTLGNLGAGMDVVSGGNIGGQFLQVYHQRKLCFQVWEKL